MRRSAGKAALTLVIRMPLLRLCEALPARAQELSAVRRVRAADIHHRRNVVRAHKASARDLVPDHFPDCARQVGNLGDGPFVQDRRVLQRGLAHEAQDYAGDDEARGQKPLASLVQMDEVYLGGIQKCKWEHGAGCISNLLQSDARKYFYSSAPLYGLEGRKLTFGPINHFGLHPTGRKG